MGGRKAFKSDISFLEKISIGAVGTRRVFENMSTQGHSPIELERGSMSFKIWKRIKIKRVRVPDILCIGCGKRVESRAKTTLEITMSHSTSTAERGWDFGLEDDDYVALVKCIRIGERPTDWAAQDPVQYVRVGDMRETYRKGQAFVEKPKGAGEGFEIRVTWPSSFAKDDGKVTLVDSKRIQYRSYSTQRTVTVGLSKKGILLKPMVRAGDEIKNNQVIASVVPVADRFDCNRTALEEYYLDKLSSASLSDRYVSAKALAHFPTGAATDALARIITNKKEHIYVRLEAASSMVKLGQVEYLSFFRDLLNDQYLENRLECVIALGEIDLDMACDLLIATLLSPDQHPEIRAGAAWSLGELKKQQATEALIRVFNEVDTNVREEAARALMRLADSYSKDIIQLIPKSTEEERAGIAWALSKSGQFEFTQLVRSMTDDETRKWVAWIIGTQDKNRYISQIEELRHIDKEVYFAVTVLWKILSSWVAELDVYL